MLNAMLSGKKRGSGQEGQSFLESFSGSEDLLTASVFERISYLSDDKIWSIFSSHLVWQQVISIDPGSIIKFTFWPNWKLKAKQKIVQPDVYVEFENLGLVIESKRYDDVYQQYAEQLGKEILAYYEINHKPLLVLAVGGLIKYNSTEIQTLEKRIREFLSSETPEVQNFKFTAAPWSVLFKSIENLIESGEQKRIFEDIREAMILHGIKVQEPVWLIDLIKLENQKDISNINENSLEVFFRLLTETLNIETWWRHAHNYLKINEAHASLKGRLK